MADELNIPIHRWYEPRNNISLPNSDFSKQWIYDSGIQKIDRWINSQPWGNPINALFALNEPGVWFDPSDLTTLFADPAGTTPVTAPGNTVGLMLDKSKGLALGAELVANGDFSGGTTGWTALNTGALTNPSGRLRVTSVAAFDGVYQSFPTVIGKTYRLNFDAYKGTASTFRFEVGFAAGSAFNYNTGTATTDLIGRQAVFTATHNPTFITFRLDDAGRYGELDNISVRELAGNHATQATLTARPTYSIEPVGGRRNLLTFSEQFDNAAWLKNLTTVATNSTVAPDGTTTADTVSAAGTGYNAIYRSFSALLSPGTVTFSFYAKQGTKSVVRFDANAALTGAGADSRANFDLANGVPGTVDTSRLTASMVSVGNGWHRCVVTWTRAGTADANGLIVTADSATSAFAANSTAGDIFLWGAQLELGSTATPYQRVTTQHDVTEAGVASVSYLYFDGASDSMATSTITPGIDKAQVFAGVRKLSDANFSVIAEFTSDPATLPGSWTLIGSAATSGAYLFGGRGTTQLERRSDFLLAPRTNVLTGLYNIGGSTADEEVSARINGASAALTTYAGTSLGSGNYANAPLYLGARGGTAIPSNIHLYSLITRFGPTLPDTTIASTETWVAGKTGFYAPIITGVPTIGVS